jgi:hypothetical protein
VGGSWSEPGFGVIFRMDRILFFPADVSSRPHACFYPINLKNPPKSPFRQIERPYQFNRLNIFFHYKQRIPISPCNAFEKQPKIKS